MSVAGVDEVGRGCLFGRVYAAAVVIPDGADLSKVILKDSKRMTKTQLITSNIYIRSNFKWAVGFATAQEIDEINILKATHLAMNRAVSNLPEEPGKLLVDGNSFTNLVRIPFQTVVKGDSKHACISAASIVAKVERDTWVKSMVIAYSELKRYGMDTNVGYGTKAHRLAIGKHGKTRWHRQSFKVKVPSNNV